MILKDKLLEKFREALSAVLPIVTLVLILSLSVASIPSGVLLSFLMGTIMLIGGMMFFSVGAEVAMEPMGSHVGARVTKSRSLPLILILVGIIYIAETMSDIIQVAYFKITHGKRIFRMAPLHHHFEKGGWSEVKIVVVFTSITVVFCVLAYLGVMNRF